MFATATLQAAGHTTVKLAAGTQHTKTELLRQELKRRALAACDANDNEMRTSAIRTHEMDCMLWKHRLLQEAAVAAQICGLLCVVKK